MIKNLEKELYKVQEQTKTVMEKHGEFYYVFTMVNGSDSVKLVYTHNINGGWSVEIYPIDSGKDIQEFQFSSKNDAIKAFQVFTSYYTLIVKENSKMF